MVYKHLRNRSNTFRKIAKNARKPAEKFCHRGHEWAHSTPRRSKERVYVFNQTKYENSSEAKPFAYLDNPPIS